MLRAQVARSLRAAAAASRSVCSVGCDSWGLDHAFLDDSGDLLELPFCYQDSRTDGVLADIARTLPLERLFSRTAAPVVGISTLGQLLATKRQRPELLKRAGKLVLMPGLVHHHLTGLAATEYCGACSSSLCAWQTRSWDLDLVRAFDLPQGIFPDMRGTGDRLDSIRPKLARELEVPAWDVCQPSGHDTALAVAAAPLAQADLVLSSGTWAMLGVPVPAPLVSRAAFDSGGGAYGVPGDTWVFMQGIMGLWLLERLRKEESLPGAAELEGLARTGTPFACCFPPDDGRLLRGSSLREALSEVVAGTGGAVPTDAATLVRSILESLALFVDRTLRSIQAVTGVTVNRVVIVGGGSRNSLLNQFTADATGLPVVTGSPEATALGNILVQARGRGDLSDWSQVRAVAALSSPIRQLDPAGCDRWAEARSCFACTR